jgi:hypothetical protein
VDETTYDRSTQDVGNLLALEHVNVTVPDQELAALFYVTGLGFTRDPYIDFGTDNMWVNAGSQQFHLPKRDAQVLRGTIGVVVPDIDALKKRMARLERRYADALAGTAYRCAENNDGSVSVTCPWGNRLRVQGAGGAFGGLTMGLPYVQFDVAWGTAGGIARFYREVIGAPACVVDVDGTRCADIRVGRSQRLWFLETDGELPAYDGHHIAVYVANFSGPYNWLKERGLITEDPRNHQFRFVDIIDPQTGEKLFEIEHEVRGMKHAMFRRDLVNRTVGQFLEPRRINGQTILGAVG